MPHLAPFSASPNPNALYQSPSIRSALWRTRVAIDHRQGLAAFLGDVGLGKSTMLRYLYGEYSPRPDVVALMIHTPDFKSAFAMARKVCSDLDLPTKRALVDQQRVFEQFLVEQFKEKRNVVIFIDEAQRLTPDCLELVRGWLNFETDVKLAQVVLSGQLDLRDRLLTDKYKALRSRVFASALLSPMTADEVVSMLKSRCEWADIPWPFANGAIDVLYEKSNGIPREALQIAETAYSLMCSAAIPAIDASVIRAVTEGNALSHAETA